MKTEHSYIINFMGMTHELTEEEFETQETIDIDFDHFPAMRVRFDKTSKGLIAVNSMDGGGNNCRKLTDGKYAFITAKIVSHVLIFEGDKDFNI